MGFNRQTEQPYFLVTVVDDDHFNQQLRLPTNFTAHFNGIIPVESIVKNSTFGRCWCIEVQRVEEDMFFQKGWYDFVEDHSLQVGESLVFEYIGNLQFNVKIYGKDGCEKELPLSRTKEKLIKSRTDFKHKYYEANKRREAFRSSKKSVNPVKCAEPKKRMAVAASKRTPKKIYVEQKEVNSDELSDFNELNQYKQITEESSPCQGDESTEPNGGMSGSEKIYNLSRTPLTRILSGQKSDRALQVAKEFQSMNPFFIVTMTASYVGNKYALNLPFHFMKQFIGTENHVVTLVDSNGRKWRAECHMYNNVSKLYSWRAFATDNGLKVEDICVFEMIDTKDIVLKVSILRK